MKRLMMAVLLFLAPSLLQASEEALTNKIESFIKKKLPHTQVGLVIQSVENGDILYQRLGDQLFYPASVTKLLSSAAALKLLGSDFKFKTYLLQKDDSIFLQFNGDPSLTLNDLIKLIAKLKSKNIQTIDGHFVIDDQIFTGPVYSQGWTWDSIPWYYSAPVSSIIIHENKTSLKIKETKNLKESVQFTSAANFPQLKVSSKVIGVTRAAAENDCQLLVTQQKENINLNGCWAIARTPHTLEISLQDPRYIATEAIKKALDINKIELKGNITFGKLVEQPDIIATHSSKPLSTLLKPILSDSNNLYTDAITKTLGVVYAQEGSFQQGVNAIKTTLNRTYNLPIGQYRLFDGSGVSRYTLMSPALVAELLFQLYHDEQFSVFHKALPRAGETGSLAHRMTALPLKGNVVAKTGSALGTSALSGYIKAKSGKVYIFSFMINQSLSKVENLKLIEDKFCELLYEQL